MIELRLLGPVELLAGGVPVDLGAPKQRLLLAALAADLPRSVRIETVVDRLWGEDLPADPPGTLHAYLSRIRRVLRCVDSTGGDWADDQRPALARVSRGYLLQIPADRVDLHRFRDLRTRARSPERTREERVVLLRAALAMWRGDPLAGLPGDWAARTARAWRQEHVDATIAWAQAEVEVGNPADVIGPLTALAEEHPLAESLTAVLVEALHAAGHTGDALDRFDEIRKRLATELGTDPGPHLRRVHIALLREGPAVAGPTLSAGPGPTRSAAPSAPGPVARTARPGAAPAMLPLDPHGFTGRTAHLARLDAVLARMADQPTAVPVVAIWGPAGVGKTALAIHWAHRVRHRFPDGQLYADLRGFDPAQPPVGHAQTLRRFLDLLAEPQSRIPHDPDSQADLYRCLLADRRTLVVLDNARDADQVRPLLPGGPGCLVVVTSRVELTGLVAAEGAHPLPLDLLPEAEARKLIAVRVGAARTGAEPGAVDEIIERCARLPMALVIVAARAASQPGVPLTAMAAELRDGRTRLEALTTGDLTADVGAAFTASYRMLTPAAARLFRLLGAQPAADLTSAAAASLAGVPVSHAGDLLVGMTRLHLLVRTGMDRYGMHDLLRAYASRLGEDVDPLAERLTARLRLLDHYGRTAHVAAVRLSPTRTRPAMLPAQAGVTLKELTDVDAAVAWLTAEYEGLLVWLALAAEAGLDEQVLRLAWAMADFSNRRGRWDAMVVTQRMALRAARRLGQRTAEGDARRALAVAYSQQGRHHLAHAQALRALAVYVGLRDHAGQGKTHLLLSDLLEDQGRYEQSLRHAQQAHAAFSSAGDRAGQARALNSVGWRYALLGEYQRTLSYSGQALVMLREEAHRYGEAHTLDSLGFAHHHLGHQDRAIGCYRQALDLFDQLGDRPYIAIVQEHAGDAHLAAADVAAARQAWCRALDVMTELEMPDADRVREKLSRL
jgi:DNA-binding SARP family transcriptional activator/tetratricopeptide (TPR) repeat protein